MIRWFRGRRVSQQAALALLAVAAGAVAIAVLTGGRPPSGLLAIALILCGIAFRKELLWGVRSRLLVTYFLFGVVPVFLIAFAVMLAGELIFAQFAAQLVRQDLNARITSLQSTARTLALAASHGATDTTLEAIRQRVPRMSAVIQAAAEHVQMPGNADVTSAPPWIPPDFANLFELHDRYYIGARVREAQAEVFAYVPLDDQTLASLTPGLVSAGAVFSGDSVTTIHFGPSGSTVSVRERGAQHEVGASAAGRPASAWWDVPIAGILPWKVLTASGEADVVLPVASRPSLLVTSARRDRVASVARSMLLIVGGFFLAIELVSLFSSLGLTRTITRSVSELYRGTQRVAEGDFASRIPVRGDHQLSRLAASFNGMCSRILELIREVRKKEKLDAELKIARQVQLSLFPTSVPEIRTLQMTGLCIPGRVVSGDYYDFVPLDARRTAIALGDVSGKGVSAALLMASIQAALHAQLGFVETRPERPLSTATLMTRLSQQLYEHTPPEKYATFFCALYDDETGRLAYTNAGHLKPILVRHGQAVPLEGGGMAAGLFPRVVYDEQDVVLHTGDLLALFSDGVPEAMNVQDEEFGETRLADLLVAHSGEPLEAIGKAVTESVERWIHDPEGRDDLTLVLLRKI
jgi:sigma-B regulation protein RsbU (phosphoserine phosphatase)